LLRCIGHFDRNVAFRQNHSLHDRACESAAVAIEHITADVDSI
jgi:hypothetical protein